MSSYADARSYAAYLSIKAILLSDCGTQSASAILSGLQCARDIPPGEWKEFKAEMTWRAFVAVCSWRTKN
jgi:hypothetical protein